MNGTVTDFDDAAGLGVITADGGETFAFHCTAITDGTRTIALDTAVRFEVRPAFNGRYEATEVTPD